MHRFRNLISVLIFGFVFLSCTQDPIFYRIQQEVEIQDGNLENNITFYDLDIVGTAPDTYYVAAGKRVWYKRTDDSSGDWKKLGIPDLDTDSGLNTMVKFNDGTDRLYISIHNSPTSSNSRLAYIDIPFSDSNYSFTKMTSTLSPTTSSSHDFSRTYLFTANSNLFLNWVSYSVNFDKEVSIVESNLYYVASGDTVTFDHQLTMPTGFNSIIEGIVFDGTEYICIYNTNDSSFNGVVATATQTEIDQNDSDQDFFEEDVSDVISGRYFKSIHYTTVLDTPNPGVVLIGTGNENTASNQYVLYRYDDGTGDSWHVLSKVDYLFNCFEDFDGVLSGVVLAGTRSYINNGIRVSGDGYKQISFDQTSSQLEINGNSFADSDSYTSTGDDLKEGSITDILYDSDNENVFISTYNSGLWRNSDPLNDGEWKWE